MKPRSTLPSSTKKFNVELDAKISITEVDDDATLKAPWVERRIYATLLSSLRKWVGL